MEIEVFAKMDFILTCSDNDKKYFKKYFPENKISVIPNGVDSSFFKPCKMGKTEKMTVVFVGLLSYPPNSDGLKFYLKEIHPLVKIKIPNVKFLIIGKHPPIWLEKIAKKDQSIQLIGYVRDIREYISKAKVCICPLRFGSGTRIKILEYMAMGKPVVSTTKGAEGIDYADGRTIFIRDNPEKFAQGIIKLLIDHKLAIYMGNQARKLVKQKYDWKKIVSKLHKEYSK